MKVKELINELQKYDNELEVVIWCEHIEDNFNVDYIEADQINNKEIIINISL